MSTQPVNTPLLPEPADYTAADFDACDGSLQTALTAAFPSWTDQNRAAIGTNYRRALCYILDILTKYQNDHGRENLMPYTKRRRNMQAILRGFGISMKGRAAASADVTFTLAAPGSKDVVIPAETLIKTSGLQTPLDFYTTEAVTISAGGSVGTASAINGQLRNDILDSSGEPDQRRTGSFNEFVEDSDTIEIDGDNWVRVTNFFNSGPLSQHYVVDIDEQERPVFIFGNGVNGKAAPIGQIIANYRTGGGAAGSVGIGTITQIGNQITDVDGNPVQITVTNAAAATGGFDAETVEQARRRVPGALRALTRTISREDFEIVALGVAGVARTSMLTADEDAAVADNAGELVVIPTGGGVPSAILKAQVLQEVTVVFPTMLTFLVTVIDPTYLTVDITVDVKRKDGYTDAQVEANINAALTALFAIEDAETGAPNELMDFGANLPEQLIPFSTLISTIAGAEGVQRVDEDTFLPADDVTVALREFPELGTVTVTFI
jgi:hypothetical protein